MFKVVNMSSKIGFIAVGIVAGILLSILAWQALAASYTYQGSLIDPPVTVADFELSDQHGGRFRLSEHRGQVVLIFFGYTFCPDVCPVTISEFRQVKRLLGDKAADVRFVYITVDPERDTRQRMKAYLDNFDPSFIGLTGSFEELEEVWKQYGVFRQVQESGSAGGYLIDHTARIYAIDASGRLKLTFPFGMEVEKIARDVRQMLQER